MRRAAALSALAVLALALTGCATAPHGAAPDYLPAHAGIGAASSSGSRHGPRFSATDWEGKPDDVPLWSNDPRRFTVLREISSKAR